MILCFAGSDLHDGALLAYHQCRHLAQPGYGYGSGYGYGYGYGYGGRYTVRSVFAEERQSGYYSGSGSSGSGSGSSSGHQEGGKEAAVLWGTLGRLPVSPFTRGSVQDELPASDEQDVL